MQVYRCLDIGTAKPSPELLERLPHHLIDIVDPDYQFNVGEFVRRADCLIDDIYERGKVPVLSGGTAFYLRNFIFGLPGSPAGSPEIRRDLKLKLKERGLPYLVEELQKVDPESAAVIDSKDSYRVIRALEVFRTTGKPLSYYRVPGKARKRYVYLLVGLFRERDELYERINNRVNMMFEQGLQGEIRSLIRMGYTEKDPGLRGIGYREFFQMRKGCLTIEGVRELIKRNSRRYAKRQVTFFKTLGDIQWFNPEDVTRIRECINRFMRRHACAT